MNETSKKSKKSSNTVEAKYRCFHSKRIRINRLKLGRVRPRKSLSFKAKYLLTAQDIIKSLTDAFISSQEETIFGIGWKARDLYQWKVYDAGSQAYRGSTWIRQRWLPSYRYHKSGPSWAIVRRKPKWSVISGPLNIRCGPAIRILCQGGECCCYGKDRNPDKGDYFKLCGSNLEIHLRWSELYVNMIEPLGIGPGREWWIHGIVCEEDQPVHQGICR